MSTACVEYQLVGCDTNSLFFFTNKVVPPNYSEFAMVKVYDVPKEIALFRGYVEIHSVYPIYMFKVIRISISSTNYSNRLEDVRGGYHLPSGNLT